MARSDTKQLFGGRQCPLYNQIQERVVRAKHLHLLPSSQTKRKQHVPNQLRPLWIIQTYFVGLCTALVCSKKRSPGIPWFGISFALLTRPHTHIYNYMYIICRCMYVYI